MVYEQQRATVLRQNSEKIEVILPTATTQGGGDSGGSGGSDNIILP
jgi:hypothetical protein